MTCQLIIGNKNYSSWSMRVWLALRLTGIEFEEIMIPIYSEGAHALVKDLGGQTGLVPVLVVDGLAIWDTLAILEYLAEQSQVIWPADPGHRATARSYAGEVHSGFNDLRAAMPCNTRARNRRAIITDGVAEDIARTVAIWETSGRFGTEWLFGEFSAADIIFAPIATRFRTYGIDLKGRAADYGAALLGHPLVAQWLVDGACEPVTISALEIGSDSQTRKDTGHGAGNALSTVPHLPQG